MLVRSLRNTKRAFTAARSALNTMVQTENGFPLSVSNINPKVVEAQYAVRGEIVARAKEIEDDIASGHKRPFDQVIYCNIGNPQQLGQQPITFFRQALALCDYPEASALSHVHVVSSTIVRSYLFQTRASTSVLK